MLQLSKKLEWDTLKIRGLNGLAHRARSEQGPLGLRLAPETIYQPPLYRTYVQTMELVWIVRRRQCDPAGKLM